MIHVPPPSRRFAIGCRRGVAATELAIALPMLVVFCLATVDFGRFAFLAVALDNAVRVGAERGATRSFTTYTYASWESDVKARVQEELADVKSGWMTDLQITVTTSDTADDLSRVDVAAQCDFSTVINWPFLPDPLLLRRQVSIRQFR